MIQNIAAFIWSIMRRGESWDFIPTTLLGRCDNCFGAIISFNLGCFQNQLGTCKAPRTIWIEPKVLTSLPDPTVRSGLCKVVRFHLQRGGREWDWFLAGGDRAALAGLPELIHRSLLIKQRYTEVNEYDPGIRDFMNYGHTFSHTYESVSGFRIPHVQGVALGIVIANIISLRHGLVDATHFTKVPEALAPLHRPFRQILPELTINAITSAILSNKKSVDWRAFCILTRGSRAIERMAVDLRGEDSRAPAAAVCRPTWMTPLRRPARALAAPPRFNPRRVPG